MTGTATPDAAVTAVAVADQDAADTRGATAIKVIRITTGAIPTKAR